MKDRDKLILSVVAVLLIMVAVGGGTYAYWSWSSAAANATNVSFTVPANASDLGLSATLNGNGSATAQNLIPAACTNTSYAVKKTVSITSVNTTNQAATVQATLKATAFTIRSASYQPSSTNLGYLKWAVTPSTSTTCTGSPVAQGTFSGITFASGATSSNNVPLTLGTISISVPANTSSQTDNYILWIWLDSSYSHTNTGTTNSDPMQGFTVTTQWSGTIAND